MADLSSMTVLVIDDMKLVRLRILQLCQKMGFGKTMEASNGAEAWKIISQDKVIPDLILTDYNMPDMNGMQFLEQVRGNEPTKETPVLFITAESEKNFILNAIAFKVADFIVKPFKDDILEQKIQNALKKKA